MTEYTKKYFAYASIGFLLLFFVSCRSARFLEDEQSLVTRTHIEGLDPELTEEASAFIQPGIRPNSTINFFLYNLFNTKNGYYKTNNIRKIGEAPRILDSALVDLSTLQINRYLFNKGYLKSTVNSEIKYTGKKAHINFIAESGIPYSINSILLDIPDPSIAALYLQNKHSFTSLRTGERLDIDSIAIERENIYTLMRRNGYFDYIRQYMSVDIDTTLKNNQANIRVHIQNPDLQARHQRYTIDSSLVTIRYAETDRNKTNPKITETEGGIRFEDFTHKFRPSGLAKYLFQKRGNLYNLDLENITYDRLYELNSFRSVKLNYVKKENQKLDLHYELNPRPYMSNQIEGEYTFSGGMSGFNLGNTFSHRNLFGGAEQLDINLRYGVLFDSRLDGGLLDRVFNNDFQIGVNITLPRLLNPFGTSEISRDGLPRTVFTSNLQVFDQVRTYSNRYFVNTIAYQWYHGRDKQHQFTPIVLEYRHGQLNGAFAQDLIDQGYLLYVRSNNRAYFGMGSQYAYTINASRLNRIEDFVYFRGAVDFSGNLLNLASNLFDFKTNIDGEKELFGVPYLQYAKLESDIRIYKHFGGDRQLVLRFNPGIAVPYGNNSSLLIFEKSFYGGGMNGMRAWQARTLGPGNYNRKVLDPSVRMNLRNLDQLGEIKLEGNVEYRFKIMNDFWGAKVKGAAFADFGNIWRIEENELNPGGKFEADKFLGQIAIGTGAGLRFDLDYFIIRFDVGAKVKDPQFDKADQWVISKWFDAKEFKAQYAVTNAPDRFRFLQYNFGIGMPF